MLQAIDLTKKSDDDLIELLKHREELMRFRALEVVHAKVTGRARISRQAQQELIGARRCGGRAA